MFYDPGDVFATGDFDTGTEWKFVVHRFTNNPLPENWIETIVLEVTPGPATGFGGYDIKFAPNGDLYTLSHNTVTDVAKVHKIDKDTKLVNVFYEEQNVNAIYFTMAFDLASNLYLYTSSPGVTPPVLRKITPEGVITDIQLIGATNGVSNGGIAIRSDNIAYYNGFGPDDLESVFGHNLVTNTDLSEIYRAISPFDPPNFQFYYDYQEIIFLSNDDFIVAIENDESSSSPNDTALAFGRIGGNLVSYNNTTHPDGLDSGFDVAADYDPDYVWASSIENATLHKFNKVTGEQVARYAWYDIPPGNVDIQLPEGGDWLFEYFTVAPALVISAVRMFPVVTVIGAN